MRPDGSHRNRLSGPPRWSAAAWAAAAAASAPGPDAAGGNAANAEGMCSGRPPAPGPSPKRKCGKKKKKKWLKKNFEQKEKDCDERQVKNQMTKNKSKGACVIYLLSTIYRVCVCCVWARCSSQDRHSSQYSLDGVHYIGGIWHVCTLSHWFLGYKQTGKKTKPTLTIVCAMQSPMFSLRCILSPPPQVSQILGQTSDLCVDWTNQKRNSKRERERDILCPCVF